MGAPRIFISMGTPYTDTYAQFRDSLEAFLRDQCKADPRIIGKNEYPPGNPLPKVKEVMNSCSGLIVVAYERKFLESGSEKRHGISPLPLTKLSFTTIWNHIELALAYAFDIPIYIICEKGLVEEGLIESKLDWFVQHLGLTDAALRSADVSQSIRNWVTERVIPKSRKPKIFTTLLGTQKLSEVTGQEIGAVFAILTGAFGLGLAAAKWFPHLFTNP